MKKHRRPDKTLDFRMSAREYHALTDSDTGLCIDCGGERDSCEPDARQYPCPTCGACLVYGAEELLTMERITLT